MPRTIYDIKEKYQGKISPIDLEILIAHTIKKSREFTLAHPEYELTLNQMSMVKCYLSRRVRQEPIAYIVGHKEFYGLNFKINRHTLIPRPETEQIIESSIKHISCIMRKTHSNQKGGNTCHIIDIGTGSGNIIVSLVKNIASCKSRVVNYKFYATDISKEALKIAEQNAKSHKVDKKIKFLRGDLLEPIFGNFQWSNVTGQMSLVILANLPYLSKEIYNSTASDVKNYEPKSALFSANAGLAHYKKLFKQISERFNLPAGKTKTYDLRFTIFLEIGSEQRKDIKNLAKKYFPSAKIQCQKDLAGKWRTCKIIPRNKNSVLSS